MKKIVCLILICSFIVSLLTGCAQRDAETPESVLSEYTTAEAYIENGTLLYPAKTAQLRYTLYDNCAVITECVCDDASVVVPAKIEGVPVVAIAETAFKGKEKLKSVVIGPNVMLINSGAFSGCTSLQSVQMSGSVNTIGSEAFYNCKALKSLVVPGTVNEIPSSMCAGCSSLTKVVIESREEVETPNTTEVIQRSIGNSAFDDCDNLVAVWIPSDIEKFDEGAFYGRSAVIYGEVSSEAAKYAAHKLMDFVVITRDEFDTAVRRYNPVEDEVLYVAKGDAYKSGNISIRYDDIKYYSQLGTVKANESEYIAQIIFTVTNNAGYEQSISGFDASCESWARDKDGIMRSYTKKPLLMGDSSGYPFPVFKLAAGESRECAFVIRVSARAVCITVNFKEVEETFYIH